MPAPDDEIKRLQRIRDQQLAARKPSEKREKYFKSYQSRHPARKPETLKDIIAVFSYKARCAFIGILLGGLIWLALPIFLEAGWLNWAGLGAVLLLGILGVIIGSSLDWREDLRKF